MTVYISGGCKNGKSSLAEEIAKKLASKGNLYYLATMIPHDNEDVERIRRHVQSRDGMGFKTIECGTDISSKLANADPDGAYLLDSVTALLSNEMFSGSSVNRDAPKKVAAQLVSLRGKLRNIVFVSDFIYADAELYEELTEAYRCGLSFVDRTMAAICDTVVEVSFGNYIVYKGELPV